MPCCTHKGRDNWSSGCGHMVQSYLQEISNKDSQAKNSNFYSLCYILGDLTPSQAIETYNHQVY